MSSKDFAYEEIRRRIINCEYLPGDVLSESSIMREISVGRTPIREALNKLENENLVKIFPKRGIFVTNINIQDVRSIYGIREVLEVYAVELAAPHLTIEQLEPYRSFYSDLDGPLTGQKCEDVDRMFHTMIYDNAGNQYLSTSLKMLYDQNTRIRRLSNMKVNTRRLDTSSEHLRIVQALIDGDVAKAKRHMKKHVQEGRKVAMSITV